MARLSILVHDGIGPVLDLAMARTASNVAEAMEQGKYEVETYARYNAPWADRSGEARAGLTASVYLESGEVVLELFHEAEHGYWLELIQDGAYAIIMPTLEALGPQILRDAGGRVLNPGGSWM